MTGFFWPKNPYFTSYKPPLTTCKIPLFFYQIKFSFKVFTTSVSKGMILLSKKSPVFHLYLASINSVQKNLLKWFYSSINLSISFFDTFLFILDYNYSKIAFIYYVFAF